MHLGGFVPICFSALGDFGGFFPDVAGQIVGQFQILLKGVLIHRWSLFQLFCRWLNRTVLHRVVETFNTHVVTHDRESVTVVDPPVAQARGLKRRILRRQVVATKPVDRKGAGVGVGFNVRPEVAHGKARIR